jgi:DNA-binding CsgD family transcriptional regulator
VEQKSTDTLIGRDRRGYASDPLLAAVSHQIDARRHALFLLDQTGELLMANVEARRLCERAPGVFQVRQHQLFVGGTPAREWLAEPIRPGDVRVIAVNKPRGSTRDDYRIIVSRRNLRRSSDPIVVLVYEPHRRRNVSRALLRRLYGLTESEAVTAAHLFHGLRPRDAAAAMHVSLNTVRSHIKRIFAKCHVKSQVDLVRLLALGPGVE